MDQTSVVFDVCGMATTSTSISVPGDGMLGPGFLSALTTGTYTAKEGSVQGNELEGCFGYVKYI